jgi:protein phosphatase
MVRLREKLRPRDGSTAPFSFAMHTHVGRVRKTNEDTCAASPEAGAFVVCDGMGGAAAGEVASRLAADTFLGHMTPHGDRSTPRTATPDVRLQAAIEAANDAVFRRARKSPDMRGMGTTLVALLVEARPESVLVQRTLAQGLTKPLVSGARITVNGAKTGTHKTAIKEVVSAANLTLTVAHVGDSRCYQFRGNTLTLLTHDHSVVEEQVRAGEITPQQAEVSPLRNIITRAVGSQPEVLPDILDVIPNSGDIYLLASDGLTRELSEPAIEATLRRAVESGIPNLDKLAHALIDEANEHGGGDNITVLLLRVT